MVRLVTRRGGTTTSAAASAGSSVRAIARSRADLARVVPSWAMVVSATLDRLAMRLSS